MLRCHDSPSAMHGTMMSHRLRNLKLRDHESAHVLLLQDLASTGYCVWAPVDLRIIVATPMPWYSVVATISIAAHYQERREC